MSEKLKTPESVALFPDSLRFCHPDVSHAEAAWSQLEEKTFSFSLEREASPTGRVWEIVDCSHGDYPRRRVLLRRSSNYDGVSFYSHTTHLSSSASFEILLAKQTDYRGNFVGQIELRAQYPFNWSQPGKVWLASRSGHSSSSSQRPQWPELSLLALCHYNRLRAGFDKSLLQTSYDRGQETTRLLAFEDHNLVGGRTWRRPATSVSETTPWDISGSLAPPDYEDKLRDLIQGGFGDQFLGSELIQADAPIADCQRVAAVIRQQVALGSADLSHLVREALVVD